MRHEISSLVPRPSWSRLPTWLLLLSLLPPAVFAAAGEGSEDNPLEGYLFPPELIMKHQSEIALREDQRQGIVHEVQQLQTDIVPLQFEISAAMEELARTLSEPEVDEDSALAQAERIMGFEGQVKTRHLTLLIRLKNLLTAEQQRQLQTLRQRR